MTHNTTSASPNTNRFPNMIAIKHTFSSTNIISRWVIRDRHEILSNYRAGRSISA